jgi:hypothetical protein
MKHFFNISNNSAKMEFQHYCYLSCLCYAICHLSLWSRRQGCLISWLSNENVYSSECPYVDRVDNLKSQQG